MEMDVKKLRRTMLQEELAEKEKKQRNNNDIEKIKQRETGNREFHRRPNIRRWEPSAMSVNPLTKNLDWTSIYDESRAGPGNECRRCYKKEHWKNECL